MSKKISSPPSLTKAKNYDDFKKLLNVWKIATDLPKEKQGAALLLSLEDEAQQAALRVTEADLSSEQGIDKVLAALDKLYRKDTTLQKFHALEKLEGYKRPQNLSMQQYLHEFERRMDKTKSLGINWPDDILAYRLLKNANLSEQKSASCQGNCRKFNLRKRQNQAENHIWRL